jgi:hypothetical protein
MRARNFRAAEEQFQNVADRYKDTSWKQDAIYSLTVLYELDLKNPEAAETARRTLLDLPGVDDFMRLRLLERLLVDVVRTGDAGALSHITAQINELHAQLDQQRQWPLRRYYGE